MNLKIDLHKIIIGLLIILIILILYKRQENAGNTAITAGGLNNFSAEALANIAKVYADTTQTAAFNNINVTSTANIKKSNLMPKGGIIIWSGDQVPDGWGLCDGTTYNAVDGSATIQSPDLRGKFVLGSGQGANLTARTKGDTGGEETHTLNVDEMPSHTHTVSAIEWGPGPGYSGGGNNIGGAASCSKTGGDKPHNNMPPFYVLAYIIKL